jgi:anti-sigma factor RsiW
VTAARKLTCRELIEFLDDYLEGELAREELESFEAHLAVCPYCVDYLKSYRETVRLGRAALSLDGPVPDDVPEDLVAAILASRAK